MSQFQPVLWNKGAFLEPQHLQHQDAYLQSLLKFRMDALTPFCYGFRSLTVDPECLGRGYFGLSNASGILRDGLIFDLESDQQPAPRSLIQAFPEGQGTLEVQLGVPQFRHDAENISFALNQDANTRYIAGALTLRSEVDGLNPKRVQIARKNLRLLLSNDDQSGYSAMSVARILKTGDRFELDPTFIPPLLHLSASPSLVEVTRNIVAVLNARSQEISQNRNSRNQSAADFSLSDTANFWLLHTVNASLPVFRHLLSNPQVHPSQLYLEMSNLASVLTGFRLEVKPNELPDYTHDDLTTCFRDLNATLLSLLKMAVPRSHISLPFGPTEQPYIYATAIPEDRFFVDSRFFLAISCEMRPETLLANAPRLFKIASIGQIQSIVNSAIPGVSISHPGSLPRSIPARAGYQFFRLETSGNYWRDIKQSRNIALFVPSEIVKPSIELIILLAQ